MRPRRVLAYCRVSSADQAEGTSLDAQREEIARYCRQHDYPAPAYYVEAESGGAAGEERRVEQARLMADVRTGDLVLVAKQDRWSRATLHLLRSVEQLLAAGARFYSIAERFDPSTAEGRFATTIMAAVAEQEHARIRDRTVGARKRLRAMGAWVEGTPPYGYRLDTATRRLVVDDGAAKRVRELFRLVADGVSSREVARRLRAQWPDMPGLDHGSIARRVHSRIYLGETHTRGVGHDGEWMQTHEPLVDRVTWRRAHAALDNNRKGGRKLAESPRCAGFLLRGLVVCAACGYHCAAHAPGPGSGVQHGGWYICQHRDGRACAMRARARHKDLDARVEADVVAALRELAAELAAPVRPKRQIGEVIDWATARAKVIAKRERVVAAIAEGALTTGVARGQLDKLEAQLADLDERRVAAERKPPTRAERQRELANVERLLRAWNALPVDARRDAIRTLVERVEVRQTHAQPYKRGAWTYSVVWR